MTDITCTTHGNSTVTPEFLDCPWCVEKEADRWQAVSATLAEALEHIAQPLTWEQSHMEEGYEMDWGMMAHMLDGPEYYKGIARAALASYHAARGNDAPT